MTLYNHPTDVFCSGRRTSVLKSKTPVNVNNWKKKKRHLRSLWNNHRAEAFWQCYWNQNMTAVIRSHTTCVHTLIRWFPWKKWNTREAPPFTMFKHAWGMPYLVFDCCRLLTWGEAQVYVWFLNLTLRLKGRLQKWRMVVFPKWSYTQVYH